MSALVLVGLMVASVVGAVAGPGWWGGRDGALLALRWTAACSAVAFLGAYVPLHAARRWRDWWRAFAALHAIHLGAILWFVWGAGGQVSWVVLVVGGPGYALLAVATARDLRAHVGPSDAVIRVATAYLWFVFLLTFAVHWSEHGGPYRLAWIVLFLGAPWLRQRLRRPPIVVRRAT